MQIFDTRPIIDEEGTVIQANHRVQEVTPFQKGHCHLREKAEERRKGDSYSSVGGKPGGNSCSPVISYVPNCYEYFIIKKSWKRVLKPAHHLSTNSTCCQNLYSLQRRGGERAFVLKCYLFYVCLVVCMCTMCVQQPEAVRTGATDGCEPSCECWEPNLGPLREQWVSAPNSPAVSSTPRARERF